MYKQDGQFIVILTAFKVSGRIAVGPPEINIYSTSSKPKPWNGV